MARTVQPATTIAIRGVRSWQQVYRLSRVSTLIRALAVPARRRRQ